MTSSTWGGEWWEREIGEICKTLLYSNPRPPPAHFPFFFTTLTLKPLGSAGILALWQQYEGSSQIGRRLRTASVPAGGVRFGNVNPKLYAAYAAERGPKAAALAKLGLPPVNVSQAVAAKAASAAAGKPDWAASKILDAAAEVTAIDAKVAGKKCVTQGSAAGPLAEKIKLCKKSSSTTTSLAPTALTRPATAQAATTW